MYLSNINTDQKIVRSLRFKSLAISTRITGIGGRLNTSLHRLASFRVKLKLKVMPWVGHLVELFISEWGQVWPKGSLSS